MRQSISESKGGGLFSNSFVRVILFSALLLQIGMWVRNYSILLYVMEMTNENKLAVTLISVAEFAPIFIFSIVGGTFADRWRPKRTMIWCDFLSALSLFAILLALMFATWKAVFFATLISSVLSQFSQPSGLKLFKLHVPEKLMQAGMSMYQTLFAVFMILGPMLGTEVFKQLGIRGAILIAGIAFLLSAVVLTRLPADRIAEEDGKKDFIGELASGFRYVLSHKMLTTLGGCFLFAGLGIGLIQPLGIFLVTERLGLPKENLSWLLTVNGAAMLIGGAVTMAFSGKIAPHKLLAFGTMVSAVTIVGAGLSTEFWLTLGFQFLSGLVMPCIHIGINTMILKNTEESFVGRVNGILNPLFMGSMVVMMSLSAVVAGLTSLVTAYLISGVFMIASGIVLVPLFRLSSPTASTSAAADAEPV